MKKTFAIAKRVAFVLLALILVFGFTACKEKVKQEGVLPEGYVPDISGKVKVTCPNHVYPNDASRSAIRNWVNAFTAKYPEVTVETEFSSADYAAQIASKSIGDVFWLSDADVYNYAVTNEALMPLDYYVESLDIDTSDVYSGILDLCVVNGKLYFAGYTCGNVTFSYNVDAMVTAGLLEPGERVSNDWTWEDFKGYAEQLKQYNEDGVTLKQVGMKLDLGWSNTFSPFLYAYGGEWCDRVNKKITLYDEKVIRGIQDVIDAIDNQWIYPSGIGMSAEMTKQFGSSGNNVVFNYNTAYTTLVATVSAWESKGVEWDIAPWPLFEAPASPCGTLGFGVFSFTQNKDAAAALVLSLYTVDGQSAFHGQEGGDIPVLKVLGQQDFWHLKKEGYEDKNYDAFIANYDRYVPGQINACVPPELVNDISDGIKNLYSAYCKGEASWQDKLIEIQELCNSKWEMMS